jgi:signal transduction histidine kinase
MTSAAPPRILLVDDDPFSHELTRAVLDPVYQLFAVASGAECLAALENLAPEVILLDVEMPEMDGYTLCKIIKQNPATADLPIIFLSAQERSLDKVRAFDAGGIDYITKPFQRAELLVRIQTHLSLARMGKTLAERNRELLRIHEELEQRVAERTHDLMQSQQELRALAIHLQNVREREAAVLARELHDELGSTLTALKMNAVWLCDRIHSVAPILQPKGSELVELIDQTILTTRRVISDLRPTVLDDLGPCAAIEWYVNAFQRRTGISCELLLADCTHQNERIPADLAISIAIYRIVQESLTNIYRHAEATRITIRCQQQLNTLRWSISDNGRGLDLRAVPATKRQGIQGMRERVMAIGGAFKITSRLGKGTTIYLTLPYSELPEQP